MNIERSTFVGLGTLLNVLYTLNNDKLISKYTSVKNIQKISFLKNIRLVTVLGIWSYFFYSLNKNLKNKTTSLKSKKEHQIVLGVFFGLIVMSQVFIQFFGEKVKKYIFDENILLLVPVLGFLITSGGIKDRSFMILSSTIYIILNIFYSQFKEPFILLTFPFVLMIMSQALYKSPSLNGAYDNSEILDYLKNNQDEITNTEILDYLKNNQDDITNTEILNYLKNDITNKEILENINGKIDTNTGEGSTILSHLEKIIKQTEKTPETPPTQSSTDGGNLTPPTESSADGGNLTPPTESSTDDGKSSGGMSKGAKILFIILGVLFGLSFITFLGIRYDLLGFRRLYNNVDLRM